MAEQSEPKKGGSKTDMRFFRFHNRITRLEKRLNSFDSRMQMIENDMSDKHKESMDRLKDVNANVTEFKTELRQTREFVERVNKRLAEFASKESVKTLEKYINLWSPLNYTSKAEVDKMIVDALGEEDSDDQEE